MIQATKQDPSAYSDQNRVRFIPGGRTFFDLLLKMIREATDSFHLQTYIFEDDQTGHEIAAALQDAAKRNVKVHLLVDGYASQSLSASFIQGLKNGGVHFRFFEPLFRSRNFYFGRRMHHKIAVPDSRFPLVGGINLSARYNDMPGKPAWFDCALSVEGDLARQLCILCWKSWNNYPINMGITPCEEKTVQFHFDENNHYPARMRRNDWVRRKNEISATYIELFRTAQSRITIMCSYFLPGKMIRRLLRTASRRGVKIKVITAGRSDVAVAKSAERWMYDWLLRNKIELYEYQPVILHAKLAVCDGEWFTIGSYNINNLSTYASIELNIDVKSRSFTPVLEKELDSIIARDCIPITASRHRHTRNPFIQFSRWCAYQFIRVVFYLLTFYYKQKRPGRER